MSREAAVRYEFERFNPPGGVEEFPSEMRDRVRATLAYWNGPQAR